MDRVAWLHVRLDGGPRTAGFEKRKTLAFDRPGLLGGKVVEFVSYGAFSSFAALSPSLMASCSFMYLPLLVLPYQRLFG